MPGHAVVRISVADVLLPTLTTWGQPVRKSRIHLQREVFEGTMVLDVELQSMNSILTEVFLLSRWERAVWSAIEIALSVDLFGRYANWSGSMVSGIMG